MYGMYRTNCYGPEMHEIYKKNCYGVEIYEIYKKNIFIVKIMGKIKLRVTNFAYVKTVSVTIMYINFLMKSMGFVKSYSTTHLLLVQMIWNLQDVTGGGEINIPTKFETNLKNLNFFVKFRHFKYF